MDPLEARNLMPVVDHYIHMNHAGVCALSKRSQAAIEQVAEAAVNRPYRAGWSQEEADRVRQLVAQLISATPEGIALTRSTAHGVSLLAQGLDSGLERAGSNAGSAAGSRTGDSRRRSRRART